MVSLRATSVPDRSSRGSGSYTMVRFGCQLTTHGITIVFCSSHHLGEFDITPLDLAKLVEDITHRAGKDPFNLVHFVACAQQVPERG